jgi:hypothetical protein
MVNSPMDIDMEPVRKSFGPSARHTEVKPSAVASAVQSPVPRTPGTVLTDDAQTQTRRILRVRRKDGEEVDYKPTTDSAVNLKRKLFGGSPGSPPSPGLDAYRSKIPRIAESPLIPRQVTGTGRKSRARKSSSRPSMNPGLRKSTAREQVRFENTLDTMTVRQLKALLTESGFDTADCIEKSELIEKANKVGLKNPRQSVSTKSTPVMEPYNPTSEPVARKSRGVSSGGIPKRTSRKHSGGKVSQQAFGEIVRIEGIMETSRRSMTCFDILGISRAGATEAIIKSRAKQLFRFVHPDKIHDESVKRRAHNVFQAINQAVEEAVKFCQSSMTPSDVSTSASRDPPKPPIGIKYSIERGGQVVLLRWKPQSDDKRANHADSFRVFASVCGHTYRTGIDQGTVTNLTTDSGDLEYAISAQSRAGNDDLFRRGRFDVSIISVNSAGESHPMTTTIDFSRKTFSDLSITSGGPSLKRHHTIC